MARYAIFEAAGLGTLEEAVYELLLDAQVLSLDDLSRARPEHSVLLAQALDRLEANGLATRAVGSPPRYVPSPPDLAIEALVLRRRGELEQLRTHAVALTRRYWAAAGRAEEHAVVQVVRGVEAVRQHTAHVLGAARREVAIIDRAPYVPADPRLDAERVAGLGRGVAYRCIYDAGLLTDPNAIGDIFRYLESGEQAQTLVDPPVKLLIADGEVAIVPLSPDGPSLRDCAVVRGSSLTTALSTCFQALWVRSVPLSSGVAAGSVITVAEHGAEDRPSALERRMVRLLAAGVKDDAIARQLDVSSRTINRYMDRMMGKLGASTRFQAGLQAARYGWL